MTDWQRDVFAELHRAADAPVDADEGQGRHARPDQTPQQPVDSADRPTSATPSPPRYYAPQYGTPQYPPPVTYAAAQRAPTPPAAPSAATVESAPAPPPAARVGGASAARRMLAGLAGFVTTSRDARESLEVHAQLTAAVPSGRRVVVIGLRPGAGSTTVSSLIAVAIAGRRPEPVLIVDAARSGRNGPLAVRLGCRPVRTLTDLAAQPPVITSREGLADHLTPVGRDVWLLPGDHPPLTPPSHAGQLGRGETPAPTAASYTAAVSGLSRYFDIVVTDLGFDAEQSASVELLTGAHALCVVCGATQVGITYADTLIRGLRDVSGRSWAGRTVILANAQEAEPGVTFQTRLAARRARRARLPIVVLPHDRALAGTVPAAVGQLAPQTHRAALRLGAALLDTAVPDSPGAAPRGADPSGSQSRSQR